MTFFNSSPSDFEQHHAQLMQRYSELRKQYDLETRVEEKQRQQPYLDDALHTLQNYRIKEVKSYLLNSAYEPARQLIGMVIIDEPHHTEALHLKSELDTLQPLLDKAQRLRHRLVRQVRDKQFNSVKSEVVAAVMRVSTSEAYQMTVDDIEEMLSGKLSVADFVEGWQLLNQPAMEAQSSGYDRQKLGENVINGNLVLFLGGEVANQGQQVWSEQALTGELASEAQYESFQGTLSAIAEYYVQRGELGRPRLLDKMSQHLPCSGRVALYAQLAALPARMVLISAAYDDLLEQAFQQENKPYVLLTSIMQSDEYRLGHVWVQYSDGRPSKVMTKDDVSRLPELSEFSIIYKLRGCCTVESEWRQDALALTESDYFNFAHHAQEIIPNYMIRQLNALGCLFIGYDPANWEERLLVDALLQRVNNNTALQVLNADAQQPLQQVFWRRQGVERCPVPLAELEQLLAVGGAL